MGWFDYIFGTGHRVYEARLGRLERRLVRRCRRVRPPVARAFALAAALSAREMDHWLFLNPSSLCAEQLPRLAADQGERLFTGYVLVCLEHLVRSDGLPSPEAEDWAAIETLFQAGLPGAAGESGRLRGLARPGPEIPEGPARLFREIGENLRLAPNLEDTLTYNLLASQMLTNCLERCRRFL